MITGGTEKCNNVCTVRVFINCICEFRKILPHQCEYSITLTAHTSNKPLALSPFDHSSNQTRRRYTLVHKCGPSSITLIHLCSEHCSQMMNGISISQHQTLKKRKSKKSNAQTKSRLFLTPELKLLAAAQQQRRSNILGSENISPHLNFLSSVISLRTPLYISRTIVCFRVIGKLILRFLTIR